MVATLELAVNFQLHSGDRAPFLVLEWEMQVLPFPPISHPPASDSWNPDSTSYLRRYSQLAVADEVRVLCGFLMECVRAWNGCGVSS